MKIPRYWGRGHAEFQDSRGDTFTFNCWGWSDISQVDAIQHGQKRSEAAAQRCQKNPDVLMEHYAYSVTPLREEVLEQFHDASGNLHAVITRNRYGCQVLGTTRIVFVDIDLNPPGLFKQLAYKIRRLLGKNPLPPAIEQENAALEKLENLAHEKKELGARVYRTRAGLRYLFTTDFADPASNNTHSMMQALDADPLFVHLCRAQDSFRARLTPKPWRCNATGNWRADRKTHMVAYPRETPEAEAQFQAWEKQYAAASEPYAVCQFLRTVGSAEQHPEIAPIVELHDTFTRADSNLPLA